VGLTSHPHVEPRLGIMMVVLLNTKSVSTAVLLNTICVSNGLLCGEIYISCTIHLIRLMMQHSLTVIPVNTNLPLTNNCTQCTVSADVATVYTIQLISVLNNINQNILYIH